MDRFTKVCVFFTLLICLALSCRSLVAPERAHASGPVMYKVVEARGAQSITLQECQRVLDDNGKQGWRLVATPGIGFPYLVFEK